MEWTGTGTILGVRKHSERNVIAEVMTDCHGRYLGLVRGGRSRRFQPILQPGNDVQLTWRARLDNHLGIFAVDLIKSRAAAFLNSPLALNGAQHLAGLLRFLPERQPHSGLHKALMVTLDHLDRPDIAAPLLVRFELQLLAELGAGLDLSSCAATGRTDDLAYVSPKSSRAVCQDAGRPYHDKLLPLPMFLVDGHRQPGSEISFRDIQDGFRLTSFFLERYMASHGTKDDLQPLKLSLIKAIEQSYRRLQPWNFYTGE